jgi:hypothetical protein
MERKRRDRQRQRERERERSGICEQQPSETPVD